MPIHQSHREEYSRYLRVVLGLGLLLLVVVMVPKLPGAEGIAGYPALHLASEVLSICMSAMVFAVGWTARRLQVSRNVQLLACAFVGVALLDFAHMASFPYMPEFLRPTYPGKAIDFWLAARFVAASALLLTAILPWQEAPRYPRALPLAVVLGFVTVCVVLIVYFPQWIPRTFVPGEGLTPAKIVAEYVLMALYLLAAFLYWRAMSRPRVYNAGGLFAATSIAAMGEFFLTQYWTISDVYNLLGHVYKIVAYLFIFRALFVESFQQPFRKLQESEEKLAATLGAIPDFLFEMSEDGEYLAVYSNRADAPLDIAGKNMREVLSPDAVRTSYEAMEDVRQTGFSRGRRVSMESPAGTVWFELSVARGVTQSDGVSRYLALARDVTKVVADERALALQADRNAALLTLQEAAESRGEGEFLDYGAELARRLTQSDRACVLILDATESKVERFGFASGIAGERPTSLGADSLTSSPGCVWAEVVQRRKTQILNAAELPAGPEGLGEGGGAIRRLVCVPVLEAGKVCMVATVANRETEYRDTEAETLLLIAEALWRIVDRQRANAVAWRMSTAVAQSPNSVAITDLKGSIEYVNRAFIESSGYSASELIGQNPRILQSGKTPRTRYEELWAALTRGESWQGEFVNRRKDGQEYTERALIYPVRDSEGKIVNYLAHKEDITAQISAARRINELSYFDTLTGLPNRLSLESLLAHAVELALHHREPLAVVWLNLDNFRKINDSLGHSVGDALLSEVAARLRRLVRDEDTLSRQYGDHFVVVLPGMSQNEVAIWAMRVLDDIVRPIRVLGNELIVTASLGIALCPGDGQTFATLLMNAESAMYRMKRDGRNGYRFFTRDIQEHSERTLALGYALRGALDRQELQLVYQPEVSVGTGALIGVEALLRWRHPQLGEIAPAEFIPIAESYGLIGKLGDWVLRTALAQLSEFHKSGLVDLTMAVNLSALQFAEPDLANSLIRLAREAGLSPQFIEIELTEAAAMGNPQQASGTMRVLSDFGFGIAIDDFGTGYSSLSYLKRFHVDKLKIDKSFVRDLAINGEDQAIVSAVIQLAHSLGMVAIAEGVETPEQLAFLREHGCDLAQGFLFSYPLTPDNLLKFGEAHPHDPMT